MTTLKFEDLSPEDEPRPAFGGEFVDATGAWLTLEAVAGTADWGRL